MGERQQEAERQPGLKRESVQGKVTERDHSVEDSEGEGSTTRSEGETKREEAEGGQRKVEDRGMQ